MLEVTTLKSTKRKKNTNVGAIMGIRVPHWPLLTKYVQERAKRIRDLVDFIRDLSFGISYILVMRFYWLELCMVNSL